MTTLLATTWAKGARTRRLLVVRKDADGRLELLTWTAVATGSGWRSKIADGDNGHKLARRRLDA